VVVGDSIWDIEAAKEAGVRAAAVMTGGAFSRAELEEAGPTRSTKTARSCSTTISPRNSTLPICKTVVETHKEWSW
jgi:ribonucleotide monophosphatase NagD (HAD superfamily)